MSNLARIQVADRFFIEGIGLPWATRIKHAVFDGRTFTLIVEHPDLPDTPEGAEPPDAVVMCERIACHYKVGE